MNIKAMVRVSLGHADAVLLVFAVDDRESFERVACLRDMVMETRYVTSSYSTIYLVLQGNFL